GALTLERAPFDLRENIEGVLQLLCARASEKNVELSCSMGQPVPRLIMGDATRLGQILVSLVSNAVKFTFRGAVSVSVSAKRNAEDPLACELLFAVTDTGIGIPENRLNRVFKSFSRVDSATTNQSG